MSGIIPSQPHQIIDAQAQLIVGFLSQMGLPSDNIIATQEERSVIGVNLPQIIAALPSEIKKDARYLSKFVVGAGMGLFDYSLNAIWNEVTLALRHKAVVYGLDIFFDAAVNGKAREYYKQEDDLGSLKDAVLLDTCRKLELIADTTYKKLKHILDMRNDIGISHPTNYTINAFELLGWLQTCIKDVLQDKPSESALHVQAFIRNLRSLEAPIDEPSKTNFQSKIGQLASVHSGNILRTVFGIFVEPTTSQQVRKNIAVIAPYVWEATTDEAKFHIGMVLEGYNTNLHHAKYTLGEQFFQAVSGNQFRSQHDREALVAALIDTLAEKHGGWNNFHHEPPVMDSILGYVRTTNDILPAFADKLIKTTVMCRIGRGTSYCQGVSSRGLPLYEMLLKMLGDQWAAVAIYSLTH